MFCGRICGSAYPLPSTWPALGIYCLPSGNIESIHSRGLARTNVMRQSIIDTLLPYGAYTQFVSQPAAQRVSVLMCSCATLVVKWRWPTGISVDRWQLGDSCQPCTISGDHRERSHRSNRTRDFLWCDFCERLINSGALVDNVMWPWAQEAVDQHLATCMLSWVLWSGYEFRGGRRKTLHIFMFCFVFHVLFCWTLSFLITRDLIIIIIIIFIFI